MTKIISYLGDKEDGGFVLDLDLHPKRMLEFIPFEESDYDKVISFIDSNHPNLGMRERWEMIDKLLFTNQ